ncbi:MAG: sigma-70 family RNA polymerase sigma factor [Gemmataceae bacterium]|nr:sigma-70 family RNA polymerase sigma factor [Gemmataceae bacterium]MCS7270281.1 sigma-70 family RNA polymerase sigma factor [Gemmataceae bacterium]MDW8244484.1 sigma-70 family RNA polymerase sigma factor [Thermogemmata sp.]
MAKENDLHLIQRLRNNDYTAWVELDRHYRPRLKAFIVQRIGSSSNDVEDIIQNTLMGFMHSLPNYDERRSLETWLFTIADHKVKDYLRARGRRSRYYLPWDPDDDTAHDITDHRQRRPSSVARSAEQRQLEEQVLSRALQEYVQDLLRRGEYKRLQVLELIIVKGWRNQDVARYLGLSEQEVANWRHQFKTRLNKQLASSRLSPDVFPELYEEG